MFTIKCDGHVLFDLKSHIVLTNPKLHMSENAAGSLEFDIDPEHPLYNSIESMVSEITVYQDGDEIWSGRPTEVKDNFFGMRSVYCEGELSYLCDTIQPPSESHITGSTNVRQWLSDRLAVHNAKAPANRRFEIGAVTVVEPGTLYRYTNYENTLECINEKLLKNLGGYLRVRKENGKRYLDYYQEYPGTASQVIRFGLNLLDHSKTLTRADIATVCLPLGAKQDKKDFEALEKYLDVSSVNGGSIYVENSAGVGTFGRIIKVVHWDNVTTASALLTKARAWINDAQYDDLQLEVNALDFHLVDEDVPAIRLLDEVRVVSEPHGLNRWFPVTEMEIPLDNPAGMVFTLGTAKRESLTSKATRIDASVNSVSQDLESLPSTILKQAQDNATELITTGALGGHVVVLPDEIYITDSASLSSAKKVWRWNLNGLGYSSTGVNGSFGTAITMDGKIVASYITAGTISANLINGGVLKLGGPNNGNGIIEVYNSSGKKIGTWDNTGLKLSYNEYRSYLGQIAYAQLNKSTGKPRWSYAQGFCVRNDGDATTAQVLPGERIKSQYTIRPTSTQIIEQVFAKERWKKEIFIGDYNNADQINLEIMGDGSVWYGYGAGERLSQAEFYIGNGPKFSKTGIYISAGAGERGYINVDADAAVISARAPSVGDSSLGKYGLLLNSSGGWIASKNSYGTYVEHKIAYVSSSSIRYKHDIKPIEDDAIDPRKLLALPVVQFKWNDDAPLQYEDMEGKTIPGIIAEDVERLYPSAAIRTKDGAVDSWDERRLIPGMLALIQEQEKRIAELERKHA